MKVSLRKKFEQFQHDQTTQRNLELIVNLVLILIIAIFVIRPAAANIAAMNESKKEAEALLSQLTSKRSSLEIAEKTVQELQNTLPLYEDALPDEPKQFDLLNTLRVVAEREEVVLEQLTHTAGVPGQVSFTITGGGNYAQATNYIRVLEQVPRLLEIEQIIIAKSEINDESIAPRLSLSVSGYSYYYEELIELLHQQTQQ